MIPFTLLLSHSALGSESILCPTPVEFTVPAITAAPYTEVVIGTEKEFTVAKSEGILTITHVGEAASVRFPSIVSVRDPIVLELTNPNTDYCIDSLVAVWGGSVTIKGQAEKIRMISRVGNIVTGSDQ